MNDSLNQEPDAALPENPLLRELEPVEVELLKAIWMPIHRANEFEWKPVWPVWDFVARTVLRNVSNYPDPIEVLRGLPTIYRAGANGGTYGLVWILNGTPQALNGNEKVGLTIAGLTQLAAHGSLDQPVHDKIVEVINAISLLEEDLVPDPSKVVESIFVLDTLTSWFTEISEEKTYSIPVEIVADTLQREYARISLGQSGSSYQVWLNGLWLRPFRNIVGARDYLSLVATLARIKHSPQFSTTPLTLVQTIDYLSYVLSAHSKWTSKERFIASTDLQSATAFVIPVNNQEEFTSRMNGIWNVIDQFSVPPIPPEELRKRYSGMPQGSITRLEHWLSENMNDISRMRISNSFVQIRAIRKMRVAGAHGSQSTRAIAVEAHRQLGLPDYISDWSGAWETVRERLASAFDIIREEVQSNTVRD